jgi:hypothetical protein
MALPFKAVYNNNHNLDKKKTQTNKYELEFLCGQPMTKVYNKTVLLFSDVKSNKY